MSQLVPYEYGAGIAFLIGALWLMIEIIKKS
jgi:hypothetical protein